MDIENSFIIDKVEFKNNKVKCYYTVKGAWKVYFSEMPFEIEYSHELKEVPEAIAVIPLLCNILPLAWLCDAIIYVAEIDLDFYGCLDDIRKGYASMYPQLTFKGALVSEKVVKCATEYLLDKTAMFFSGGVDAFHTLIRHAEEKPCLITIWGADVMLDDLAGWENVCRHVDDTSKTFGLENIKVKSNFRELFNEVETYNLVACTGDDWWHGFQCGLGLLGHGALSAYVKGYRKFYIASSFSEAVKGQYTCASDPTIDNNLRYCSGSVFHDAYEYSRQNKIKEICEYATLHQREISLRVCWQSKGGRNCCRCEKCYRTILEIESEKYDSNDYGFVWNDQAKKQCKKDMIGKISISEMNINSLWRPIQARMLQEPDEFDDYHWLLKMNWDKFNEMPQKRWKKTLIYKEMLKFKRMVQKEKQSN